MNFNDIRKMANAMHINTYRMKKEDIVRAIQHAENNFPCYSTERVNHCCEDECLWRPECVGFGHRMLS